MGQVPGWLDLEAGKTNRVSMLFTSELYGDKKAMLPVFNSLALESQFSNVPTSSPENDVMIYFNDDMFLANEHSVSDFWNPVCGLNINVDHRAWVENQDPTVAEFQRDWNSEWTTLRHSNFLLSISLETALTTGERFGWRRRTYVAHFAKPLSRTVLKELQGDFGDQLTETAKHHFRSEGKDVNTIFLHTHYVMERHREVLLESYLVHRADANGDGKLDAMERKVISQEIENGLKVRHIRTTHLEQLRAMGAADLPLPKMSRTLWASTDGYPFAITNPENPTKEWRERGPPQVTFNLDDPPHKRKPQFDFVEMCLTADFTSDALAHIEVDARMLFRLLAKDYPYCGDTLLAILVPTTQSGLHQLLPPPTHKQYREITHKLHQYAYTISSTTSEFIMARSVDSLTMGFSKALRIVPNLAQICVNDDVENGDIMTVQKMDLTFKGILQGFYGAMTPNQGRSPVEKPESVEEINSAGLKFWGNWPHKGGPGYTEEAMVNEKL